MTCDPTGLKFEKAIRPIDAFTWKSQATPPGTTILAFANFKGGVGKTTCAVNVAGCLAYQFDKKVLLIDLDVQASLGQWLLGPSSWLNWTRQRERTTHQIFLDVIIGSHTWSVDNATLQTDARKNLYVCPATFEMQDLDAQLHYTMTKPHHPKPFQCLDIQLKRICGQFDYIILDCPPNMYSVTQNALFCSDYVVIPTLPDFLSTAGLKRLVGFLKNLREQFRLFDADPVRIGGIVFNKYDNTQKKAMEERIGEVDGYLDQNKHANDVFSSKAKVFSRRIRNLSLFSHAQERHLPVTVAFPQSEAAKDIIQFTYELMGVV